MLRHLRGLLPLPDVQFWETENGWRLDSSHRGGHRRDSPSVVDASDVRTVSALKTSPVQVTRLTALQHAEPVLILLYPLKQPPVCQPRVLAVQLPVPD
jgi:hypothetical protein